MRLTPPIFAALAVSSIASAQTYTISTFAGGALPVGSPAISASIYPVHLAADPAGNVYFVDQGAVLRLDAKTGILTLVAGTGSIGYSGDGGPATSAQLSAPQGLALDSAGNLYIADGARVRKVSGGVITTVAGNVTVLGGDGGPATDAVMGAVDVAVDSAGNLYIADSVHQSIRKVSNGVITTIAGNGTQGFSGDNGPATSAQLSNPNGVAVDAAGDVYIADEYNNRVRKVSSGIITTVAGTGTQGFSGDNGPAASAQLSDPTSVAVDSAGNLYVADFQNQRVREVSNGVITTVAGTGIRGFSGDNSSATSAQLYFPVSIAMNSADNLYIADLYNARVRRVSKDVISTIAGNGQASFSGDNGPAVNAELNGATGVALDSAGSLYIADQNNDRIRKVSGGVITTVAGNGTGGFGGDGGPALNAGFIPIAVAVDSDSNLYITDYENVRIREVSNGIITTVAGNGTTGYSGDNGPAIDAQLNDPKGIAVDSAGNLYIADAGNNCVRRITKGVITTVAGNGTYGFGGDGGPATNAQLRNPAGLAVDSAGNLYIADTGNGRIRIVSNGVIATVAGVTAAPGATYELDDPVGVAVDSAGSLYIAEALGGISVAKVSNGVFSILVDGGSGFNGDGGPAITAQLVALSVAIDSSGNLYIAGGNSIRLLTPGGGPYIMPGGILDPASSAAGSPVAPGSIASVYGSFLFNYMSGANPPLPANLYGLSLQFGNGLGAPLSFVSTSQVNFQVPWELTGLSQTSLAITVNGQTSGTRTFNLATFAPGIFSTNGQGAGQGAILDTSYRLVDSSNAATAGSTVIQIYCTGLGPVTNQPPSGSPPLSNQLSQTTATPTVTIGGVQAQLLFSGLAPALVGVYQVNALVPASSSKGPAVPIVIAIGGAVSNTVTIAVQ